jgi:hypothetical protein
VLAVVAVVAVMADAATARSRQPSLRLAIVY